jgi:hypothetical protein
MERGAQCPFRRSFLRRRPPGCHPITLGCGPSLARWSRRICRHTGPIIEYVLGAIRSEFGANEDAPVTWRYVHGLHHGWVRRNTKLVDKAAFSTASVMTDPKRIVRVRPLYPNLLTFVGVAGKSLAFTKADIKAGIPHRRCTRISCHTAKPRRAIL